MSDPNKQAQARRMRYLHRVRVRYSECDMQGVVFNATYLAYVYDCIDVWLQQAIGTSYLDFFDYQVKKVALEWSSPARSRDVVERARR